MDLCGLPYDLRLLSPGLECPYSQPWGPFASLRLHWCITDSRRAAQNYHSKEWDAPWTYVDCRTMSDNFKNFHVGQAMHAQLAEPMASEQQEKNVRFCCT